MRSFESIREEIIDDEEREQMIEIEGEGINTMIICDKVYWRHGYEAWRVVQLGEAQAQDGSAKSFVTMIRLHDSQLRTILTKTFYNHWKHDSSQS